MYIESLELKNFRNYERLSLQFDQGTNVFYGDNAQGKTNILEAINVLGTTRSHKGSRDSEMIRFGEDEAHLRLFYNRHDISHKIDIHLRRHGKKGAALDGIPVRRAADLFGTIGIVFFSPEDLNVIKNGPKERRRFLDSELSQLSRNYLAELGEYNRIIDQRNALLKDIPYYRELEKTLDVWDEQMIRHGAPLIRERKKYIEKLNPIVGRIHDQLTEGREKIELIYEPDSDAEGLADRVRTSREKDLKMKTSTVGPHRDDFRVMINGIDIRHFGSQGQQRSAALSLKLSEINMLKDMTGEDPVLLMDDVLSELDAGRQKMLLQNMNHIQTFITCTGMDEFIENSFTVNRAFHIVNGSVDAHMEE